MSVDFITVWNLPITDIWYIFGHFGDLALIWYVFSFLVYIVPIKIWQPYPTGNKVVTDVTANDGSWTFLCGQWSSADGSWAVFQGSILQNSISAGNFFGKYFI
jgi:hypothetical protein